MNVLLFGVFNNLQAKSSLPGKEGGREERALLYLCSAFFGDVSVAPKPC